MTLTKSNAELVLEIMAELSKYEIERSKQRRAAERELKQAEDELRQFRANTSMSMSGKVRKETLRGMVSYKTR